MTAKNKGKTAKPAARKTAASAKTSKPAGLLSKIKGALAQSKSKKPEKSAKAVSRTAAAAVKPVKPAKPASRSPVKTKTAASAPVKAAPAVKKGTKPAGKAQASVKERAVAPSTPPVSRRTPAPAKNVTKTAAPKKSRNIPSNGPLTEDDLRAMSDDEYMNDAQLEFFRRRLLQMRQEVLQRELDVKERLHEREVFADPADRATAEEEHWLDLRLRERESLLLRKIDDTLRRIEAREYGYCEKTGDPIGIPRLLARPTATVCVDVKGQDERVEAQFRDR